MPNPVEGLLEVYEDVVEVLLVLERFFTKDSYVEDLLYGAFSWPEVCSSAVIFSAYGFNLFSMIFSMTLFGWLKSLQTAFLGSVMTNYWGHGVGQSPVRQIFLQIVV